MTQENVLFEATETQEHSSFFHTLLEEETEFFATLSHCKSLEDAKQHITDHVALWEHQAFSNENRSIDEVSRVRDCASQFRSMLTERAEKASGFSLAETLYELATEPQRLKNCKPGFFAELLFLFRGLENRFKVEDKADFRMDNELSGRDASLKRSNQLDRLAEMSDFFMNRYRHGLEPEIVELREKNKQHILEVLQGTEKNWTDWVWQTRNVVKDPKKLDRLVSLSDTERTSIEKALRLNLPFGVTPFYLSLMGGEQGQDRSLRYQVFPPSQYVETMEAHRDDLEYSMDFMGEHDTSPEDLITRRYVGVLILKPYNTCPQICVYCQRNWEIDSAMAPNAMASPEELERAIEWIAEHPSIHEVLVTGGDPLILGDGRIRKILERLAEIDSIERIRIGTRIPVTMPMRITSELADMLGEIRDPGRLALDVVTHIQHPYEINPDMVLAVDRLRTRGIMVYNQMVYTFFNSRRFEASYLRRLLKRVGVDPYYTFNAKGKEETVDYRVPIARLLQEQKEETRLSPGLARTDEAVFNVPLLGKNYLRANQYHDWIGLAPDGSRIFEFHPWERNIAKQDTYVYQDVPILSYLNRLQNIGENPDDYSTIWYYF